MIKYKEEELRRIIQKKIDGMTGDECIHELVRIVRGAYRADDIKKLKKRYADSLDDKAKKLAIAMAYQHLGYETIMYLKLIMEKIIACEDEFLEKRQREKGVN